MTGLAALAADAQVLAGSGADGDGGAGGLVLLLLLAGPVFYAQVYLRYRNTDKRHRHEAETRSTALDVRSTDVFVESRKGLRGSRMKGATSRRVPGS